MHESNSQMFGESIDEFVRITSAFSANGTRNLSCIKIEGVLLFEGDIIVRPQTPATWFKRVVSIFGHGVEDSKSIWPNGVIPVAIHADLREIVSAALEHWMALTPLRFTKFEGHDCIAFQPSNFSASEVGRIGGIQTLHLRRDVSFGSAVHEIGHAVGLWHEHSRSDRLKYVDIWWDNIHPDNHRQFTQPIYNADDIGPYDYDSIMHYPSDAFSVNGASTITAKSGASLGQREGLSEGDILAIQQLYSGAM